MKIETIEIEKINLATYNPRKDLRPGDPEYEALKRSIETWGYVDPLIWNERSGNLVGGHQRLKIILEQGEKTVQVSVVDLDDANEKALNIALNKISGGWNIELLKDILVDLKASNFDLALTGFDLGEIAEITGDVCPSKYPNLDSGDKPDFETVSFILHKDQANAVREAMELATEMGPFDGSKNHNKNGNAIARVCEIFTTKHQK